MRSELAAPELGVAARPVMWCPGAAPREAVASSRSVRLMGLALDRVSVAGAIMFLLVSPWRTREVGDRFRSVNAVRHAREVRALAIALTFDDGPGAVTTELLDVLGRHAARATFDVLGERIAGREGVLRRLAAEGHEVGVHGWSHGDHRDDPEARAADVARAANAVLAVCGTRPRVFRPPFGSTTRRLETAVAARGLTTVLWDVDPRDYEEPGADVIYERMARAIRPGSIVLLHDDRPELAPTADAVDRLLAELRRRAWQAVTVSELLGSG